MLSAIRMLIITCEKRLGLEHEHPHGVVPDDLGDLESEFGPGSILSSWRSACRLSREAIRIQLEKVFE